jgi:hypothetical protein
MPAGVAGGDQKYSARPGRDGLSPVATEAAAWRYGGSLPSPAPPLTNFCRSVRFARSVAGSGREEALRQA